MLLHLALTTTLGVRHFYQPHFTDVETEALYVTMPKVIQLLRDRVGI